MLSFGSSHISLSLNCHLLDLELYLFFLFLCFAFLFISGTNFSLFLILSDLQRSTSSLLPSGFSAFLCLMFYLLSPGHHFPSGHFSIYTPRVCIFFALFSLNLSIPFPQKYNDPIDYFLLLILLIFLFFNWNENHSKHEDNFGTEKDDRQQISCAHILASLLVLNVLILWNGWPWLASADLTYGRTHFLFSFLSFAYVLKS